jgi:restriction system protein
VDVIVQATNGEKWIVQCKRYSGSVGEPIVRDLFGTMLHEDAQKAYLMTTGSISNQAREWAQRKPIILYEGEDFVTLIRRTQRHAKRGILR